MALTPEREAEIDRQLDAILGPRPRPRPKLVVSEGRLVDDRPGRSDRVTINMEAYEKQRLMREADEAADRARRRANDPCRLGIWGPVED